MSKKLLNHVDYTGHEIRKVSLEKLGSPLPSGVEGRIVYSTVEKLPKYFDGTSWKYCGLIQTLNGTAPITMTLSSPGNFIINITPASVAGAGSMSAADKIKLDGMLLIADDTDVPHDPIAGGNTIISSVNVFGALNQLDAWNWSHVGLGSPDSNRPHLELKQSDLSTDNDLGGLSTSHDYVSSQRAIKEYVDNVAVSSGRAVVPFDPTAAAGSDDLPLSYDTPEALGGGTDIVKGDQFIITTAGTVGASSFVVNPNDKLIANIDLVADDASTQLEANWTIIPATTVLDATETVKGIARLATQTETDAGTDDTTIVTPKKLEAKMATYSLIKEANNSGTGTTITVTHNFANRNVQVTAYLDADGTEMDAVFTRTTNTVQADIDSSLTPGSWTVTVLGEDLTP